LVSAELSEAIVAGDRVAEGSFEPGQRLEREEISAIKVDRRDADDKPPVGAEPCVPGLDEPDAAEVVDRPLEARLGSRVTGGQSGGNRKGQKRG